MTKTKEEIAQICENVRESLSADPILIRFTLGKLVGKPFSGAYTRFATEGLWAGVKIAKEMMTNSKEKGRAAFDPANIKVQKDVDALKEVLAAQPLDVLENLGFRKLILDSDILYEIF